MSNAGIRALGRLRDKAGLERLIALLDHTMWARHAADALGDFGDRRAVSALIAAYPKYAKDLKGQKPSRVPEDDVRLFSPGSADQDIVVPVAVDVPC